MWELDVKAHPIEVRVNIKVVCEFYFPKVHTLYKVPIRLGKTISICLEASIKSYSESF